MELTVSRTFSVLEAEHLTFGLITINELFKFLFGMVYVQRVSLIGLRLFLVCISSAAGSGTIDSPLWSVPREVWVVLWVLFPRRNALRSSSACPFPRRYFFLNPSVILICNWGK